MEDDTPLWAQIVAELRRVQPAPPLGWLDLYLGDVGGTLPDLPSDRYHWLRALGHTSRNARHAVATYSLYYDHSETYWSSKRVVTDFARANGLPEGY
jgi:hypothetical protein